MDRIETKDGSIVVYPVRQNIFRCIYTKNKDVKNPSEWIEIQSKTEIPCRVDTQGNQISVETDSLRAMIDRSTGAIRFENPKSNQLYLQEQGKTLEPEEVVHYTTNGEKPVIQRVKTVDGERNFVKNLHPTVDRIAYRGKLYFSWQEEEAIHGLGQGEEGIYNYRHHVQYLYQHNMRIPIPFLVSSRQYAILLDCGSIMTFHDDERGSYLLLDTVEQLDYYFIAGSSMDDLIDGYRFLTGKTAMLPRWAYGYVQSKEAYKTGEELEETVRQYRKRNIPIDCIVQDWNTWEPGKWGQKTVDKERYPDLPGTIQRIHDMHVHTMVSVWPNMNAGGENHQEMFEQNHLLYDYATYNAFDENARTLYWKQCEEELFSSGFDAWWCDSTEPFSGPDWGGAFRKEPWERYQLVGNEHKRYLDAGQANLYALYHAKGIFENQRKTNHRKRVLNLTRSGYAGSQKYGTVLWSGDISANWNCLKRQITEGLNMALSGISNWTLDIGAFFVVGSAWWKRGCGCHTNENPLWFWKGEYNDGVEDFAYRELYVRWLEYGTFLPMFRSHGTDTPREIWNFGEEGEPFYDAIAKYIRLRYQLMPYIYSLAGHSYLYNGTILRSLVFDFPWDARAAGNDQEFMFGKAFLICPVTEPMYYAAGNVPLEKEKTWPVYLPEGCCWHDFWTGKTYRGGQEVLADAPLDAMPIFVRAGSIVPMAEGLSYADQVAEKELQIYVYDGADGEFVLYEDAGDGYAYENGEYSLISLHWSDKRRELILGNRVGSFEGMKERRSFLVVIGHKTVRVDYEGQEKRVICP